ncbi:MAG TPA: hypothetical protein VN577_09900 [Terriglobales bacterium]|nr:hypothetical protein [Terriglobales bacterium]
MTLKRVFLAGILGAVAMFAWNSIAHMATPLGELGISEIPNEHDVLASMQSNLGSAQGMYMFPGMGLPKGASQSQRRDAMTNYQERLDKYPSGLLIYHPVGQKAMTPGQLGNEFAFELVQSLLLALVISVGDFKTFGCRLIAAGVVGAIAAVSTNMSYWNWYGFPTSYTLGYMTMQFVGFLAAGTVIALLSGRGSAKASTARA